MTDTRTRMMLMIVLAATTVAGGGVNPGVPWPAVDDLNRVLPEPDEVGPPKADRFVGIFYFLWLVHFLKASLWQEHIDHHWAI